ncbi:MAG: hypothetical protein PHS97_07985 [Oscillospiraceae bacterium]|nr:hypothetical protein [Oscillospiraceae bacterium]
MEKKNFYTQRNSPFVWLSVLLMTCSVVVLIHSAKSSAFPSVPALTAQILLPILSNILFVLVLLFWGETRLYRVAIPFTLGCVGVFLGMETSYWLKLLCLMLCSMTALCFALTVAGSIHSKAPCVVLLLGSIGAMFAYQSCKTTAMEAAMRMLPILTSVASVLIVSVTMRERPYDGRYHYRWGDRVDGRRVRAISPMDKMIPYIMSRKTGACNQIRDKIEVTQLDHFVHQLRREGLESFGLMHILIAAYVRTVSQYPAINRFVSGQRVYTRGDNILVSMVVKKEMSTDAPETCIKVTLSPTDTVYDVYRKFNEQIKNAKEQPLDSAFDKLAEGLVAIPGVCLRFTVHVLSFLDYFGLLPQSLLQLSPFHGSLFVTSMGSLGIPPVVHHLYDFGNLPVFLAFGAKRPENRIDRDGNVIHEKYLDYTFMTDDRICDGFYYASALRYIRRCMQHPEQLRRPPEKVTADIA